MKIRLKKQLQMIDVDSFIPIKLGLGFGNEVLAPMANVIAYILRVFYANKLQCMQYYNHNISFPFKLAY